MKIKIFPVITAAYLIFWGPLFLVTLVNWDWDYAEVQQGVAHEVTLHVAFVHSFVNPALLMVLHRGIRQASQNQTDRIDQFCEMLASLHTVLH